MQNQQLAQNTDNETHFVQVNLKIGDKEQHSPIIQKAIKTRNYITYKE